MISQRLRPFGTTIFTEMTRLANEHRAINLAQGFPDFDGPDFLKQAAKEAIDAGHNQYARMYGVPALNAAIAAKYARTTGLRWDAEREITVTSGCTEAIAAALLGMCDPGDRVILFEPWYDSYRAGVCMAGAEPVAVTLRRPGWGFDRGELRRAFASGAPPRAILINTPHNPTGKVFSQEELSYIAALCLEYGTIAISDEVYEHLVYAGAHLSIAELPGMRDRTLVLSSLGKTFSVTGWKVGWACGSPPLTAAVRAAHQFLTFATATPLQHAAVRALEEGESCYRELATALRERRDFLVGALRDIGFEVEAPAGTYFVCAGFGALSRLDGHAGEDDRAFAMRLIREAGVAVIPPSVFYADASCGQDYVRFAFCKRMETLEAAVSRLRAWRVARGGA